MPVGLNEILNYSNGEKIVKESKRNSKSALIMRFMPHAWIWFVITIIASTITTLSEVLMPQIVSVTVDSIIGDRDFTISEDLVNFLGGRDALLALRHNLGVIALALILAGVVGGIFRYISRVASTRGSESYVKNMRDTLFSHIQRLPFSWHSANRTGDIIQRCTSDVDQVCNFVAGQLINILQMVFRIVIALVMMYAMNVKMALIASAFAPIVIAYSFIFYRKIGSQFTKADEAEGVLSTIAQENLTGVRVVRAFGRERYEIDKFEKQNQHFTGLWVRLGELLSWFWILGDWASALQILLVMVVGSFEAVAGNITAGQFIAFVSYNAMFAYPVRNLGRIVSEMSKAGVSIDRLNYILSSKPEEDKKTTKTAPLNGDIEFKHVRFGYGEQEILKDVSFTIPAGSTFAILGGIGSGKSTLMHLLNRLYELGPDGGSITISGVDIADMPMAELRSGIGMVLQEPFLFSRTVGENIGIARQGASLEEIREAAASACLDDSIEEFALKYDTVVGERGVTLSGGQKQRVAIARMLIQKTPIMVFDDSLSAVDTETDAKIRAALKKHMAGSTVILISHRVTTLMGADTILVLDEGKVAEIGTHEQLMAKHGIYRSVYDLQMSGAQEA